MMKHGKQVRHVAFLDEELSEKLMDRSEETGAKPTEIIRRALRAFLKLPKEKGK